MNVSLVIVSHFWLHVPHILSILINSFICRSHINFICFHLIFILFSNNLSFGNWLLISWWTYSNWNGYFLVHLFFILFTFLVWVKMYVNVIWIIIIIIFIVSIMVWAASAWKIASRVVIRVSVWHHWRSRININNIITSTNINSAVMSIFG